MSTRPLAPKARHITKHEAWVCCAFCLQHLANDSPKELKEDMATRDNKVSLDMPEPLVDCAAGLRCIFFSSSPLAHTKQTHQAQRDILKVKAKRKTEKLGKVGSAIA